LLSCATSPMRFRGGRIMAMGWSSGPASVPGGLLRA
jgi:hypothetical protein